VEGLTVNRLVGLLGWLGVVLVLAAVAIRFTRSDLQPWSFNLAIAGLVVIALYALTQWRDIARSLQGRNVKYGSLTAGSVVLFLGILAGVNWIGNRYPYRVDLTEGQQFTLSDQTRQIVRELTQPVKATAFYDAASQSADAFRDKLDEYAYLSSQFTAEYIDAVRDPTRAQALGVQTLPTVVFEHAGRTEKVTSTDEQALTNALKKVVLGQAKKVYFLQGHGEGDTESGGEPTGFFNAARALQGDNFEVAKLALAQAGAIPDDATVLVVAGPTADALPGEIDLIKAYLAKGGKLLLMVDPAAPSDRTSPASFVELAREWGIELGSNIIVDQSGLGQLVGGGAETPVGMPVSHPITNDFGLLTAFRLARSAAPIEGGASGRFPQKFLESSPQSWAEADIAGLYKTGRPERNLDKGDVNGPVAIASAVSAAITAPATPPDTAGASSDPDAPRPETRVAVFGDSDFANNRYIGVPGNAELFLNTMNWLAQQENLIAIRPKSATNRPLVMTGDQQNQLTLISLLVIPVLLIGNAARVWWKRR
jgi:ABC-type uncharacterized transport system involved in gliding motility auxiliary subunit